MEIGQVNHLEILRFASSGAYLGDEEGNDVPIVDKQGRYVEEITDFAGMFVKNEYYPAGEAPEKSLELISGWSGRRHNERKAKLR